MSNDHWPACIAYVEAECNPFAPEPALPETVRYAHVLWTLTEAIGAHTVLEIGIGPTSVSGCTFVHSMGHRGGGRLFSVDIDPKIPQAKYRELAQQQGVDWQVFYGESLTAMDLLPADLQVDLLYIDGDHDDVHAYGDTMNYLKFLRPGGYLVIDDYPGFEGVACAGERLQKEGFTFVHLSHHPPHGNGRLLWQKPGLELCHSTRT